MTITQALETLRNAPKENEKFSILLACSFTPLHMQTLLAGQLQVRLPRKRVLVTTGEYGDLAGTLERAAGQELGEAVAVALEWHDIDSRFAYREAGAWGPVLETDILIATRARLDRFEAALRRASDRALAIVSLPTLPLPPAFRTPTWQAGEAELLLQEEVFAFARRLVRNRNVRFVNPNWIAPATAIANRLDLKSELLVGLPYTVAHAGALAEAFARLIAPAPPLKGIITDLDDTFWNGIVGEVGAAAVRWEAASRYHLHGLYQKTLAALAEEGVLVGIASKNDPLVVHEALKRNDLLISPEKIFPIEVHWAPKSESVTRILRAWNISADSVAFVDDTPLELAEVASVHAGITCLEFPNGDYEGVLALLRRLRDLCSRGQLTEEDAIRIESIRGGAQFQAEAQHSASIEDFLRQIDAKITFDFDVLPTSPRVLELINKTNQFNLNGVRFTEKDWERKTSKSDSFLATIQYADKFGPLGIISVIQGYKRPGVPSIETWVMSCRAFGRRIEHQCLKVLFETFDAGALTFAFVPTAKNGPLREFFASILGALPEGEFRLSRHEFFASRPPLYHVVEQAEGVGLNE